MNGPTEVKSGDAYQLQGCEKWMILAARLSYATWNALAEEITGTSLRIFNRLVILVQARNLETFQVTPWVMTDLLAPISASSTRWLYQLDFRLAGPTR